MTILLILIFSLVLATERGVCVLDDKFQNQPGVNRNGEDEDYEDASIKVLPICDEDTMMMYLAELQAVNPESIVNLATINSVNDLCDRLKTSLKSLDTYLKDCRPASQNDLYVLLIKGVKALNGKLCLNKDFKHDFMSISSCIQTLHDDYHICQGPADWMEAQDYLDVCKTYKSILECYYVKTAKLCGQKAAHIMKGLMQDIINNIVTVKCRAFIKSDPHVVDAMPPKAMVEVETSSVFYYLNHQQSNSWICTLNASYVWGLILYLILLVLV